MILCLMVCLGISSAHDSCLSALIDDVVLSIVGMSLAHILQLNWISIPEFSVFHKHEQ